MNKLTALLALVALALAPGLGQASANDGNSQTSAKTVEKWYRVEVIIFTQRDVFGDELSSRDITMTYADNLIDLDDNNAGFIALPDSERELVPDAYSLKRTGVYKVLYHKAWRQPGLAPADAPWININTAGNDVTNNAYKNTALNGSLRVYLSSYLHAESNLWHVTYATQPALINAELNEPAHSQAPNNPVLSDAQALLNTLATDTDTEDSAPLTPWPQPPTRPQAISATELSALNTIEISNGTEAPIIDDRLSAPVREIKNISLLKQASRLKLNKLHYFDHPKMGLLIKVVRDSTVIKTSSPIEPGVIDGKADQAAAIKASNKTPINKTPISESLATQ